MHVLIGIALKSLLIAGLTLGLLALMKRRSAAERSWVAHIGLLALVIMAFAPLVLPSWNVEAPALLGQRAAAERRSRRACARRSRPTAADAGRATTDAAGRAVCSPRCRLSPAAAATGALCRSGRDPAAHHLPRAGAPDRAPGPRRRAGRRPLAERARPRAAAHGLQARHRAAHQQRARLADQLGPDAPGDPAQHPRGRSVGRSRSDHRPRACARRPHGLGQAAARPRRDRACSGSTRWSGCSPAKRTSCARKRPTTPCSPPTSPTPIMRSCWSASPATNAPACCSARMASRLRRARLPAGSRACSTASRSAARSPARSRSACSSAPCWSPLRLRR